MTTRPWTRLLPWMTVFAVAMGLLEAAVVFYLRAIYYPDGFVFPLAPMAPGILRTEVLREAATLVMLLAPGALLSRSWLERFAWFCWAFAVWDLCYYVFLKAVLGWPESLFTWDVLFLLPTVWVGPVLAPCLVSLGLMLLSVVLLRNRAKSSSYRPRRWQWGTLMMAGMLILWTFMEGPCRQLRQSGPWIKDGGEALTAFRGYVPQEYQWGAFLFAMALAGMTVVSMARPSGPKG